MFQRSMLSFCTIHGISFEASCCMKLNQQKCLSYNTKVAEHNHIVLSVAMAFWINIYECQPYPRHGHLVLSTLWSWPSLHVWQIPLTTFLQCWNLYQLNVFDLCLKLLWLIHGNFVNLWNWNKKSQKSPELKSWPSFYFMEAVGTLVWVQCVYKVGGSIHQRRKKLSIDHNPPVMMECKHKMRAEMGQKHLWSCNSNFVTLNTARPRVMRFFVHKKTSLINR